eukprot:8453892-Alexandrium_andersonii.AAC.1
MKSPPRADTEIRRGRTRPAACSSASAVCTVVRERVTLMCELSGLLSAGSMRAGTLAAIARDAAWAF